MSRPDFDKRIARARALAEHYPAAAQVLKFYAEIAAFQKQVFEEAVEQKLRPDCSRPFDEQLITPTALERFPMLIRIVEQKGPPGLAQSARDLRQQGPEQWRSLLETPPNGDLAQHFFARVCQQPVAEYLALHSNVQFAGYTGQLCPVCGDLPQLSVLRPEGDGGKRSLVCADCATEWEFRRVLCPNCAEQNHEKLPRYSAEDFPHVRVEACDTCKRYLKSVDLTINGLAVPLVDEIAAAPLDLWAAEHGYEKIELNLMGL